MGCLKRKEGYSVKEEDKPGSTGEIVMKKQTNLLQAVSIIVGSIIGSGIFNVSLVDMLQNAISVGMSFILGIACGSYNVLCPASFAKEESYIPQTGGKYVEFGRVFGYFVWVIYHLVNVAVLALKFIVNLLKQQYPHRILLAAKITKSRRVTTSALPKTVMLLGLLFILLSHVAIASASALPAALPPSILNTATKTFSPCIVASTSCPKADKDRDKHIYCLTGYRSYVCPDGYSYKCEENASGTGYLVENCYPRITCPKGKTSHIAFDLLRRLDYLECRKCSEYMIQKGIHDSADSYVPGCTTRGATPDIITSLGKTMVLLFDGGATDYYQAACDTSKGYCDAMKNNICNITNYCICTKRVTCPEDSPILLPNSSCSKTCYFENKLLNEVFCKQYEQRTTTSTSTNITSVLGDVTSIVTPQHGANEIAQGFDNSTGVKNLPSTVGDSSISYDHGVVLVKEEVLIGLGVAGVILTVILIVGCCFYWKKRIQCCKSTTQKKVKTDVRGNYIKVKGTCNFYSSDSTGKSQDKAQLREESQEDHKTGNDSDTQARPVHAEASSRGRAENHLMNEIEVDDRSEASATHRKENRMMLN